MLFRRAFLFAILAIAAPAHAASLTWNWSYTGAGINASGTFTTVDTPTAAGGYLITAITGQRNGETITALWPTGTPIPGNDPFNVDNLIFLGPGPQMTTSGFGYSTSAGHYSNPFYAGFLAPPVYLDFFSFPPDHSEPEIQFSASPTPEPRDLRT